jgi:hypothetical protein
LEGFKGVVLLMKTDLLKEIEDISKIQCNKCKEFGHYTNACQKKRERNVIKTGISISCPEGYKLTLKM